MKLLKFVFVTSWLNVFDYVNGVPFLYDKEFSNIGERSMVLISFILVLLQSVIGLFLFYNYGLN